MSTKIETLDRIMASARKVFAVTGLKRATMTGIAEDAGVTKQLLYHYYQSKNDLFSAVLNQQSETILSALGNHEFQSGDPAFALRAILELAFDQYKNDPYLPALAQEAIAFHNEVGPEDGRFAALAPALNEKMAALIQRGIDAGKFKSNIDPNLFSGLAILVTLGGFYNSYMLSSLLGFDTRSEEGAGLWRSFAIDFLLNSIRIAKD